jgi:small subunit ribosomal protein S1
MEDQVKFDIDQVERTFTQYKLNQMLDGIVVAKRDDGVIFNIGGKQDAFIGASDFSDFSQVKVGDRFKVIITKMKNEFGMVEVSKTKADNLIEGTLQAKELKLGKVFSFVVTGAHKEGLTARLGEFQIVVPIDQIETQHQKNPKVLIGKKVEAIVTDIDVDNKLIAASIKMLSERNKQNIETAFWRAVFRGKLVSGTVEKIMPYGVFVLVNGVMCFCHISELAHFHVKNIEDVVSVGKEYTFKIIDFDKQAKKVSLSLKATTPSPKQQFLQSVKVGDEFVGTATKILDFGAIVRVEPSGFEGLLHIHDASLYNNTRIYEIVKVGEQLEVIVKSIDTQKQRVGFELKQKR